MHAKKREKERENKEELTLEISTILYAQKSREEQIKLTLNYLVDA